MSQVDVKDKIYPTTFTQEHRSVLAAVYAYILSPSFGNRKGDSIEIEKNTDQESVVERETKQAKGENDE